MEENSPEPAYRIKLRKLLYRGPDKYKFSIPQLFLMAIGKAFVVLFIGLLMFLCVEYASRIILPHKGGFDLGFDAGLTRHPFPFIMFKGKPNSLVGADQTPINVLGYRGPAPELEKDSSEFRIFILGGSTVFNGDPPLPQLVERLFHKEGHTCVSVFNFGVVASNANMELARVMYEVSNFQPDLIVFYNGVNDMATPFYVDPRPGYHTNFFVYPRNPYFKPAKDYPGLTLLAYNSNLFRLLLARQFSNRLANFEKLRQEAGYNTDAWRDEIAESYLSTLQKTQAVSKAFGAEFITIFQPLIFYKDQLSPEEMEDPNLDARGHHLYLRERIRSLAKACGDKLNFQDLSDFFDDRPEQVFTDFIHITQEARGIMAAELVRQLNPYLSPKSE